MTDVLVELDWKTWARLREPTREAWRRLVRAHGFDPNDVGLPLLVEQGPDGPVMVVREYLLNDQGRRYLDAPGRVAQRVTVVPCRAEVALPSTLGDDG